MKKFSVLLLVAVLMMSVASCGKKDSGITDTSGAATPTAETTQTAEASGGDIIEGAGKEVDMDKIEGKKLESTADETGQGKISSFDVSIDDAKLMDYEGGKILIVSFSFKNNTSSATSFDGFMSVDVTQDGKNLRPAVITGVEGLNINSSFEQIEAGAKTNVQKTYIVSDETTPVDVVVYKYGEPDGDMLTKSFNLN